jgi:hypothetical protein
MLKARLFRPSKNDRNKKTVVPPEQTAGTVPVYAIEIIGVTPEQRTEQNPSFVSFRSGSLPKGRPDGTKGGTAG